MKLEIRDMRLEDADGKGDVHCASWQETYPGLVDSDYSDSGEVPVDSPPLAGKHHCCGDGRKNRRIQLLRKERSREERGFRTVSSERSARTWHWAEAVGYSD